MNEPKMKTRILFVCHGNICRSPMAEFIMKKLVRDAGREDEFEIASAATSTEEIGSDMYHPAKVTLRLHGVPFTHRAARQVTEADFHHFDHIYLMDRNNQRWMSYILPAAILSSPEYAAKVQLLMSLAGEERDVADPWYTGNFEKTYTDIMTALQHIV
ncbi:MAG: low molecular weight protein-tyrosine-phosphatase [Bacteroidales bacterium]|nr:low molecular weight protein-tyrosine-phosphatase [Bacteroidales bacterium]